jgi:hypothetical protein
MKLGIMQPYFFPYLGYFDLINRSNKWIIFDTVKYQKKSWMNRNRVMHPDKKNWLYIYIPVKNESSSVKFYDIYPDNVFKSKLNILGKLSHYRQNKAPYYDEVISIIDLLFDNIEELSLSQINTKSLILVCNYLNIDFNYIIFSECEISNLNADYPGHWALLISEYFKATEYINPPGGKEIFRKEDWIIKNIKLTFTELENYKYNCKPYIFHSGLSIIDVMMWSKPSEIKSYLDNKIY